MESKVAVTARENILKGQSKVPNNSPVLTVPSLMLCKVSTQSILHLQQGPATVCSLPESLYFMISFTYVLHSELAELEGTARSSFKSSSPERLVWFSVCGFWEELNSTLYLRHTAAIGDHPLGK